MMTMEYIKRVLKDRKTSSICRATGLHANTVRELKKNPLYNPNYDTYRKLVEYVTGEECHLKRGD